MPRLGLVTMLEIAAGLSIAGPMFVVGVEFARSGEFAFGIAMFTLGVVAMFFPSYFLHRFLGRASLVRRVAGRVRPPTLGAGTDSDAESTSDSESDHGDDPEPESTGSRLLNRLRR